LTNIACVLFDLDGTLVDTIDLIRQSFDYAVKAVLGLTLSKEKLLENVGRPLLAQMESFSPARAGELMDAYNRHNLAHHDRHIRAYPHAVETLQKLKGRSLRLAVVTSKKRELALRGLSLTGLLEYMDLVVAMEDTTRHKPEPEPVVLAMRQLECGPEQTLFVGDSPFDMAAGRAAGAYIGAAYWGPFDPEQLDVFKPDIQLFGLADLPQLIP